MDKNRTTHVFLIVALGLSLAGCGLPNHVAIHISRQEIQQRLAARFPIEKRDLLFKSVVSDPVVRLDPGANLVHVDARARLEMSRDVAIAGLVSMVGSLEYDPAAGALYIRKIRVEQTHIESVPPKVAPLLDAIGGLKSVDRVFNEVCKVAPPRIADVKIAELPGDWRGMAARAVIRTVRVNDDGIDVEIGLPH